MVGEGLDVGQVVVRTVFLEPLADVLLGPQHHGFGQAGQGRAGVVHGEGFARTQLKTTGSRKKRDGKGAFPLHLNAAQLRANS